MGKLYQFLGVSVAVIQEGFSQKRKRAAFNADITYLTANSLGFTFLQDTSTVDRKEDLVRLVPYSALLLREGKLKNISISAMCGLNSTQCSPMCG